MFICALIISEMQGAVNFLFYLCILCKIFLTLSPALCYPPLAIIVGSLVIIVMVEMGGRGRTQDVALPPPDP